MLQDPKWKVDNSEYTEQFDEMDEPRKEWFCLDCLEGWSNQDDDYNPSMDSEQCPYCRRNRVQEIEE